MRWRIERRLRFGRDRRVVDGVAQFGFHTGGVLIVVEFETGWIACVVDGAVAWTAGVLDPGLCSTHVSVGLDEPRFAAAGDNALLVSDSHVVHRIDRASLAVRELVDTSGLGVQELGNCVPAPNGHLWINDIVGHQVLELTGDGRLVHRIGDGTPGFQQGTVGYGEARFGWIYDLRSGPDGRIYVLDSTNYAVRVIDPGRRTVTTICGDGRPGSRGDGGPAVGARLGGDPAADFDGPWSLVVDARGDVYIGDTHNHAVRWIDAATGRIDTIADATSTCPPVEGVALDGAPPPFTKICGLDLDPAAGRLLVPDWVSDEADELLVLAPGDA